MGHIILDSGLHGDDFVKNKRTITIKYKTNGIIHDVLCFKVNDQLWLENGTYGRRVWRLVTPKIHKATFFIKYPSQSN